MSWFEKKFGKYALDNLPLILIVCYGIGYTLQLLFPKLLNFLYLNPYEIIFHFQIWRIVTWVIVPPDKFGLLTLLMLYFYYSIGTTLSSVWGKYKYNVYIFSGILFTILGSFILFGISMLDGSYMLWYPNSNGISIYGALFSTYYINMSIFLAYAATFPDAQVMLMLLLPIRVKYLGIIYGAILVYEFISYASMGAIAICVPMLASLLNFLVFFLVYRKKIRLTPMNGFGSNRGYTFRKRSFGTNSTAGRENNRNSESAVKKQTITRHKCAICGKTDESDPSMQFRFCSKCNGNYEYCETHLFTHTHIK